MPRGCSVWPEVIELLDDLKGKVEADLANEEKLMNEYTNWCDEEANTKEDAITSSKRTIKDLQATIEDANASIQTCARAWFQRMVFVPVWMRLTLIHSDSL